MKQKKPPSGQGNSKPNVIHVAFGQGGGRVRAGAEHEWLPPKKQREEAVSTFFNRKEAAKIVGLTESRLSSLDKHSIVSPSEKQKGRRVYTFSDIIALKATRLLAKDVKISDVKKAIIALKKTLPDVKKPFQELRLVSDGRRVVVHGPDGIYEPISGQLVMNFELSALKQDVVRFLRPKESDRARAAYDLYLQASKLDETPDTLEQAKKLYERAVQLDPNLAIAYTNLGNVLFRQGDMNGADDLYQKALELDDRQPEAHYNLGYVRLERGDAYEAAKHLERAIAKDPRFADAHFNLAVALEQLHEFKRAREHWKKYLELEPKGAWADIARTRLGLRK